MEHDDLPFSPPAPPDGAGAGPASTIVVTPTPAPIAAPVPVPVPPAPPFPLSAPALPVVPAPPVVAMGPAVAPAPVVEPIEGAAGARPSTRRRWRVAAWLAVGALAVAVVASSVGFALVARRDAQHNYRSARAWQDQATAAQRSVSDQQERLVALEHDVAELKTEVAQLTAARDAAVARSEGLQGLLDDANRRLSEAEGRVAALAGAQARAGDQAIIGR